MTRHAFFLIVVFLFFFVPRLSKASEVLCPPSPSNPAWRGILIRGPKTVTVKKGGKVSAPFCGYLLLDVPSVPSRDKMRLIATNKRSGRVHEGGFVTLDPNPEVPPPRETPVSEERMREEKRGLASGGPFQYDLANFVDLPAATATYEVRLEFLGNRSNAVTFKVVLE